MNAANLNITPDETQVKGFIGYFSSMDLITGLKGLTTLVIGLIVVRILLKLIRQGLGKSKIPPSIHSMLCTLLRIVLDLVVVLSAANVVGIPITSFVTLLGLAGLAISLALQGVLENLAGGVILLASQPFRVGEAVETDGMIGIVRDIRLMNTRLESFDGKHIYIPNSKLYNARIVNYTQNGRRRVELSLSASYDNSPEQVRTAVLSAVKSVSGVLEDPPPVFLTEEYADSAIRYMLWIWCKPEDYVTVKYGINEKLYSSFASHGVVMTYPHLNVHIRDANLHSDQGM